MSSSSKKPFIICVDDEKVILDTLAAHILKSPLAETFEVEQAESGDEALDLILALTEEGRQVAVVISDQLMPRMSGDELLAAVHELSPDTQNILLTGNAQIESVIAVINKARLFRYLPKPWDKNDLILTIETAGNAFIRKTEHDLQNRLLAKLYEATSLLSASHRAEVLSETILRFLMHYFDASDGALMLFKSDENVLIKGLQKITDEDGNASLYETESDTEALPEAVKELVLNSRKHYYNDFITANNVPDFLKNDLYFLRKKPKTLLAIPLLNQEQIPGIIYFDHTSKYKAFTEDMEKFWELFAPNASIALSNALLYEDLDHKSKKLAYQKRLIEEKILQTTESIRATERIQKALMFAPESISVYFSEAGMIFKPRDIVSGDFYWLTLLKDKVLLAAADCTGHGIPGAMLSVLGINLLDRIVNVDNVHQPNEILVLLDQYMIRKLQQENHTQKSLDGMDISIISYDLPGRTLEFAAAGRPLIIQHKNGSQDIYKGDKYPIGGQDFFGPKNFELQTVNLTEGDSVFLFSDGITDQFGGKTNDKKFSLSRLQNIFSDLASMPLERILNTVERELADWQGMNPQTDDIMLIGFRI